MDKWSSKTSRWIAEASKWRAKASWWKAKASRRREKASRRRAKAPRRGPQDYWRVGPVYVWKWICVAAVIALSVAVLTVFGLPWALFQKPDDMPPSYRYDDPRLANMSGLARILDSQGRVRFEGEVAMGSYTGQGRVYDGEGQLVYEGPLVEGQYEGSGAKVYENGALVYMGEMSRSLYEGQGRRTDPETGTVSAGQFSRGFLEGEGQEFYPDGTLLREGTFSRDLLEGGGREYGSDGTLLREGTFSAGLLHGSGLEYAAGGTLRYEGQFRRGVYHGQGKLYDTLLGVPSYEGAFADGKPMGLGSFFHPSGQALYTGQVYGDCPRADAFLGLSLAEVEAAFAPHWLLYICGDTAAFVYPYFHLMFITKSPVPLVSSSRREEQAAEERRELLDALERQAQDGQEQPDADGDGEPLASAAVGAGAGQTDPEPQAKDLESQAEDPEPQAEDLKSQAEDVQDEILDPDVDKTAITVIQVLSYGGPLAGVAQPDPLVVSGRHQAGWREWFATFAQGAKPAGVSVRQSGPFIYQFTPGEQDGDYVDEFLTQGAGVVTMTVLGQDKGGSIWYQTAEWEANA